MESDLLKAVTSCCLSGEPMREPVFATDGYVYERSAILEWFDSNVVPVSPVTRKILTSDTLIPAHTIDNVARAAKVLSGTMVVPKNRIRYVIGTGGKTIKAIQMRTGTRMHIYQQNDPCIVEFIGGNLASAKQQVSSILLYADAKELQK